jgi:chemotaxis methyl-accepting protein methylase
VFVSPPARLPKTALRGMSQSRFLRKYVGRPYLLVNTWIWNRMPASLRSSRPVRGYGSHLHRLVQSRATRTQYIGTFFFRNRPELELLTRLLDQIHPASPLEMAILGCSKGAEVYSFSYALRTKRPDLNLHLCAVDISKNTLEFAKAGVYSLKGEERSLDEGPSSLDADRDVTAMTSRDQTSSIFERVSSAEMKEMFEQERQQVRVRPRFRDGISWRLGDANDPGICDALGFQDIVVANRFLCHMHRDEAEACLRNIARLVKGGGYLFVSGVDLGVRTKIARELGWRPVTELIVEIHEGDPSLRSDWPLEYWGLEPFDRGRDDWSIRYASVFQLPQPAAIDKRSQAAPTSIFSAPTRGAGGLFQSSAGGTK